MSRRTKSIASAVLLTAALTSCEGQAAGGAPTPGAALDATTPVTTSTTSPHVYTKADELSLAMSKAMAAAKTFHMAGQAHLQFNSTSSIDLTFDGDYQIGKRGLNFDATLTAGADDKDRSEIITVDQTTYFRDFGPHAKGWSEGVDTSAATEWGTVQSPLTFVKLAAKAHTITVAANQDDTTTYNATFDPSAFFQVLGGGSGQLPDSLHCTTAASYRLDQTDLPSQSTIDLTCSEQGKDDLVEGKIEMRFSKWRSPVSVVPPRK